MLDKQYTKADSLMGSYFSEISRIPLLSKEEETELAKKALNGNKAAKDKLVTSNLRFVVKLAKQYQNLGLDLEDLISEGNLGLIEAVDHFNPDKGFRFLSYAVWWVRRAMLKAIEEKGRTIRLPANKIQEIRDIESIRATFKKGMTLTSNKAEATHKIDFVIEGMDFGNLAGSRFGWGNAGGAIIKGYAKVTDIKTGKQVLKIKINHVQGPGHFSDRIRTWLVLNELVDEIKDAY